MNLILLNDSTGLAQASHFLTAFGCLTAYQVVTTCPIAGSPGGAHHRLMTGRNLLFLAAAVVAFGFGLWAGRGVRFTDSIPNMMAMWAPILAVVLWLTVVIVGIVGISTLNVRIAGVAAAIALGAILGQTTGPVWQAPVELQAHVDLRLGAPISETFSGTGGCDTVSNGDLIRHVWASDLVHVDGDRMSLRLTLKTSDYGVHGVELHGYRTEGRLASYNTPFVDGAVTVTAEGKGTVGTATFSELTATERGERLGGPGGPRELDGTVVWTCD